MPSVLRAGAVVALALVSSSCGRPVPKPALRQVDARALRTPEDFASITGRDDRARALFGEASRVLLHPRCVNCHPNGDSPTQGEDLRRHDPPVARGPGDRGVAALECTSCHQDANLELARVPGAADWHLAPIAMAWVGKTPRALCEQVKDRARNGNRSLEQIVEHAAHDPLVAWGWAPGHGREPAPGSQAAFGALLSAWVRDGAACPEARDAAREPDGMTTTKMKTTK